MLGIIRYEKSFAGWGIGVGVGVGVKVPVGVGVGVKGITIISHVLPTGVPDN